MKHLDTPLPDDWIEAIDSVLRESEKKAQFSRAAIIRELRRRGVDVSKLSEPGKVGNPEFGPDFWAT